MKNQEKWTPSWIVKSQNVFKSSTPRSESYSWYINKKIVQQYIPFIVKYAKGLLLDVGCGKVPFWQVYKDNIIEVHCMDRSDEKHTNIFLDIKGDINDPWPLKNDEYDTILSTDVLAHLKDPLHFFRESSRCLKPNGVLIVTSPFVYWLSEYPYDYFRLSEFALENECKKNGLEVLENHMYGGFGDVLMDTLNKWLSGRIGFRVFRLIEYLFRTLGVISKLNSKFQGSYPLGYILVARKQ